MLRINFILLLDSYKLPAEFSMFPLDPKHLSIIVLSIYVESSSGTCFYISNERGHIAAIWSTQEKQNKTKNKQTEETGMKGK